MPAAKKNLAISGESGAPPEMKKRIRPAGARAQLGEDQPVGQAALERQPRGARAAPASVRSTQVSPTRRAQAKIRRRGAELARTPSSTRAKIFS